MSYAKLSSKALLRPVTENIAIEYVHLHIPYIHNIEEMYLLTWLAYVFTCHSKRIATGCWDTCTLFTFNLSTYDEENITSVIKLTCSTCFRCIYI